MSNTEVSPLSVFSEMMPSRYVTHVSDIHADIGGSINSEQQDASWVYQDSLVKICVIADGHGKILGKIASAACIKACREFFTPEKIQQLLDDPYKTLTEAFIISHNTVREDFSSHYIRAGGFHSLDGDTVDFRNAYGSSVMAGGSTLTITVFTDEYIFTANVGDSKSLAVTSDLSIDQSAIVILGDSAKECGYNKFGPQLHFSHDLVASEVPITFPPGENVDFIDLTASHSPTDKAELDRLVAFRQSTKNPLLPYASLRYPDQQNIHSRDIYSVVEGAVVKSEQGYYIKNVSGELASLFATPDSAQLLAMTRSIGDFYGVTAGLSHRPEVRRFNLKTIFDKKRALKEKKMAESIENGEEYKEDPADKYVCVAMGSDGIWDNWKDKDVKDFITFPNCIDTVEKKGRDGVNDVAKSFSVRNKLYGERNFGNGSDNAICVIAMIREF